ncbi:intersectin-2 isoform X1 [Bactrocera neohumeralis]|uniref:intersectin-2 isoform X1 n=1 Tax=Bactrocera tryoni TaxID=59916 RepID=UPI001A95FFD8|nr:intersectin-2 isoform X1 [Bactrocera tryoni]XP_039950438.1 intersectin-2 isoform X1 [Bactrocera tryoni]XP_039950439.1 intersectin-2 isoform X1 [Bactrocera tryoni]XP_039950440.1 intersectin-2 isoform X1 [Bactrocera tryoni]XP_050318887.1 intersectin-2 isoform X1 [Bactrocera neohumeralis]XP_050318888.1 intersectin-2 isoform X1 [Bactrocera neohumeralis]XP_050318889.1 intersectin-2 isoform X1 [Bactrocera neohumeralis]XP_050318890.1 intersectin-2 isoform X1 [Bactrocera neohumeralis]
MNAAIDPWVITQREKLKYQEQFKALQPQGGFVTGAQAKGFFLQSQLPPLILGQIWALADTDSDGKMNINEFSIACKLINLKLRGMDIPKVLPPTLLASLSTVGSTPTMTPTATASMSPLDPLKSMSASVPVVPPTVPISGATLPGAVPAVPGIVPGTLPGVLPQTIPAAITTGVVPGMPTTGLPMQMPINAAGSTAMVLPGNVIPAGVMPVGASGIPGVSTAGIMSAGIVPPVAGGVPVPGMVPMSVAASGGVVQPAMVPVLPPGKIVSPPSSEVPKLPATPTPPQSNPPSRHMSISERAPSIESPQSEWAIKGPAKRKYTQVFNATDRTRSGYLTGAQARSILVQSKLPQATLAQIWTLSDLDSDGRLSCDEFILAMFLCDKAMNGEKVPVTLPLDWIPPSFRKTKSRQGSISGPGSRAGSTTASRHASVSSQGAVDADPAAGLPQTTFEDKRKENFDKGQAELDRRRKLLQDQQRKEKEERERKEREEAEKREKARLEAERKQQEELERQLQKQRELEMEKEEQRKRELEAKEAARKELEKQRQMEWEQSRIAEMNAQKQREQERVLKQKAHNTQLNVELSTLNEKIKDLSQKICDTRAGVTNVKTIIDGMRSQRDTSMTDMSQLKARIKEQNAKLLQLTQERAKWDAKSKSIALSGATDTAQQEQLNAAFANKQLLIKQLKDKVENIRKEIDSKKEDINSNDIQVAEVKGELSALIAKCEELYADYDTQRTQVLELKYNKKNDNVTATSAWDTGSTAWGTSVDQYALSNDTAALTETTTNAAAPADTTGPAPEGFVKYRAIYEFTARNQDEITFVPGDIILVPLEQNAEPGWLAGEINGHTGWFPETYVEKLEDDYATATTTPAITAETDTSEQISGYAAQDAFNDNSQSLGADAHNGEVEYYIAAYPYASTEVGDLSFNAGEMVMVIKKEGDWWTGTIGTRTGMFPSNYVQKADVGTASVDTALDIAGAFDEQKENGNADTNASIAIAAATTPHDQFTSNDTTTTAITTVTATQQQKFNSGISADAVIDHSAAAAAAEETRTNEDLDTEVSQINTQSKSQNETAESFSRPMSRTSSMTPGMRAKRSEIAQVIAPYEATSPEQLSLTRGQLIMIRKKTDSGWWEGELQAKGRRRQIGWFPATYVKVLQGGRNSGRNTPVSGSRIEMTEQILDKVIALYPYKAQNDDELSFEKDDIISVLGRDEPEWWRGELNGLSGLFPSNYVGPFVTSGKKAKHVK